MEDARIKLKIVSDGTPHGTKIVDQESGKELNNVKSIFWCISADGTYTNAAVEFTNIPVEIAGEFEVKKS